MSEKKALGVIHDGRSRRRDQWPAQGHRQGREEGKKGFEKVQLSQISPFIMPTEHHKPGHWLLVPELRTLRCRGLRWSCHGDSRNSIGQQLLQRLRSELDEGIAINHWRRLTSRRLIITPMSCAASSTTAHTTRSTSWSPLGIGLGIACSPTLGPLGALCALGTLRVGLSIARSGVGVGHDVFKVGKNGWQRRAPATLTLTTLVPVEDFTTGAKIQSERGSAGAK